MRMPYEQQKVAGGLYKLILICDCKKNVVRSGIRTHARIRGPEHPNSISHVIEQALCLSLAP